MILIAWVLGIGLSLIAGQHYFPDNIVMWFSSPSAYMMDWRQAVVALLALLMIAKATAEFKFVRVISAFMAVGLWWASGYFFMNDASYIFDYLFLLAAGTCFAIAALRVEVIETPQLQLQPHLVNASTPLPKPSHIASHLEPSKAWHITRRKPIRISQFQYLSDIKDDSHTLYIH
jgi:hypothetical protein